MNTVPNLLLTPVTAFDFSGFTELAFPKNANIVYVLCFKRHGSPDDTPFYVGESSRHLGRLGDYVSAKFAASTDFKVGQAVKQLQVHGEVTFRYKDTNDRRSEEKKWIETIEAKGFKLLNRLGGYNYTKANEADEIRKVGEFVASLLSNTNQTVRPHQ